jgi:hypothetical protein
MCIWLSTRAPDGLTLRVRLAVYKVHIGALDRGTALDVGNGVTVRESGALETSDEAQLANSRLRGRAEMDVRELRPIWGGASH